MASMKWIVLLNKQVKRKEVNGEMLLKVVSLNFD